ncbi:Crp/Fnr family transcriptional regulator [Scopulibacillus cellulosilyticus]|uniref:Crp/Fnr family transcriptional regulator n=1 Tax=Scopulibacillus cellulosilyticus TaxID=2665665 RepID=A0ABW2Q0D9_9BACL
MDQPQIAVKIMKIMGQKMAMLMDRVQELISQDVQHRIIRALIRLASESGKKCDDGIHIDIPLTNKDFANMVGSTRETINRVLNRLKKGNLLKINHHHIVIYNLEALENFS